MYRPEDMQPGTLIPGEHEANPPHFGLTQQQRPDFSPWAESYANHGFQSHLHQDEALRRDMAVYYGMVSFMDQQIGRILSSLDDAGLAEDTVVVFTTDHGHFLGQHGLIAKGAFHYEDLIRVPFLVRWPGRVPAGRAVERAAVHGRPLAHLPHRRRAARPRADAGLRPDPGVVRLP